MRQGVTAILFGLGLAVSPVLAAPDSQAVTSAVAKSASAPDTSGKKNGHGGRVALWIAIGVAVLLAVQSARGRKTDVDKDEK
jgi:hypothetical protein